MNFDWTAQEHDLRTRVAALFDGDAAADLEAMEQAGPKALKERTAAHLASLSGMGYLSLGQGTDARKDTMRLMAAQEELAAASGPGLIGCTQVTEILYTPGVQLVSVLPREFELATVYTAAVSTKAGQPQAARMMIDLLVAPEAAQVRRDGGFQ